MTSTAIDPSFPQLNKILDANYMMAVLQNVLFGNNGTTKQPRIEHCNIVEKRHKPGKRCHVLYQITLKDIINNTTYEQLLTGHLLPVDQETPAIAALVENSQTSTELAPVSYMAEQAMMLWRFPHDRKLQHLPKLVDVSQLKSYFSSLGHSLGLSKAEQITAINTKVMHYLPEQSCMMRYTLNVIDTKSGLSREIIVYGKHYADDSGLKTYASMSRIAEQMAQCAKPLHYDAKIKTLWQAHIAGQPFSWILPVVSNNALITNVAQCIAAFHRCELNIKQHYGITEINKQLTATCKIATAHQAALGSVVAIAVQRILFNYQQIDWSDSVNTPIHLDLKMGNLLIDQNENTIDVTLIDLDSVCLGDPLADLASFIANLYLNGLRAGSTRQAIDQIVWRLISDYRLSVTWFNKLQLMWYISAALLHEVLRRSLLQQNTERLKINDEIIALSNYYSALCQMTLHHIEQPIEQFTEACSWL